MLAKIIDTWTMERIRHVSVRQPVTSFPHSTPTPHIIKYQCWGDIPPAQALSLVAGCIIGLAHFTTSVQSAEVSDDNVWKGEDPYCWLIHQVIKIDTPIRHVKGSI
ncbi:hypothetical protein SeLEV6574_g01191 [Synchytrium endobioticum]|uniref:Uncharacterized protein n=1 Tax=Synchytrium endobioticum TaxID=286115 RepID=A0A507DEH3_9FUNG|nr:hypothetical protein SeLEV6574_g01191 [Synchytrium endobioticum]